MRKASRFLDVLTKIPGLRRKTVVCTLVVAALSLPAWGQNARANSNTATAVLHIQATVLSVVYSPSSSPKAGATVAYNFPSPQLQMDTLVQVQPLSAGTSVGGSLVGVAGGELQTTTTVAR
jgi:hypothetical protein